LWNVVVYLPWCRLKLHWAQKIKWGIVSRNKLREVDLKDPADAKAMVGSFFVGWRRHGQRCGLV
jgi:hypothetical protein